MAIDKFDLNLDIPGQHKSINENFEKIDKFLKNLRGLTLPDPVGVAGDIPFLNSDLSVKWQRAFSHPVSAHNYSINHTIGSDNSVTFYLRHRDGTPPTKDNPVLISTRNTTLTDGIPTWFSIEQELSCTLPSGATLGFTSAKECYAYLYFIGTGGGELGISGMDRFDEGELHTTTAIGTGSDSINVLYSPTAQTSKPVKLLGRFAFTQTTAGTWASRATEVSPGVPAINQRVIAFGGNTGQTIPTTSETRINYDSTTLDTHGGVTTGASWQYTVPKTAIYLCSAIVSPVTAAAAYLQMITCYHISTQYIIDYKNLTWRADVNSVTGSKLLKCNKNDTIFFAFRQDSGSNKDFYGGAVWNHYSIIQVGNV